MFDLCFEFNRGLVHSLRINGIGFLFRHVIELVSHSLLNLINNLC